MEMKAKLCPKPGSPTSQTPKRIFFFFFLISALLFQLLKYILKLTFQSTSQQSATNPSDKQRQIFVLDFTVHLGRIKWGAGVLLEATNNACPVRLLTQITKKMFHYLCWRVSSKRFIIDS